MRDGSQLRAELSAEPSTKQPAETISEIMPNLQREGLYNQHSIEGLGTSTYITEKLSTSSANALESASSTIKYSTRSVSFEATLDTLRGELPQLSSSQSLITSSRLCPENLSTEAK